MQHDEVIPILDFGAQYAQLIARRVREQGVYEPGAPKSDPRIFDLNVPILGICYGMQLGAQLLGGQVKPAKAREFGRARLVVKSNDPLVKGLPQDTTVWMS